MLPVLHGTRSSQGKKSCLYSQASDPKRKQGNRECGSLVMTPRGPLQGHAKKVSILMKKRSTDVATSDGFVNLKTAPHRCCRQQPLYDKLKIAEETGIRVW